MFVVFDLDGTLALNGHRLHHIRKEPRDYAAYEAECPRDGVCSVVLRVLDAHLGAGHAVEIWTGRSQAVYGETIAWLGTHGIDSSTLSRMRAVGDSRANIILKREWLYEAKTRRFNQIVRLGVPDLVYDDDPATVAMWRSEGVACFQVAGG